MTAPTLISRTSVAAAGTAAGRILWGLALGHLERVAAAARGDSIRVLDLEPGLLDRLEVVDLCAHQVRRAEWIDHDGDTLAVERVVALLSSAIETEAVLEAGAAAALDGDTQHRDVIFRGHEVTDRRRRRRRQRDDALGALLDLHLRRIVATGFPLTRSRSTKQRATL